MKPKLLQLAFLIALACCLIAPRAKAEKHYRLKREVFRLELQGTP